LELIEELNKKHIKYWNYSNSKVTRSYLIDTLTIADFYVFALGVIFTPEVLKVFQSLKQILAECGWIFAFENVCIVCSRPMKLSLDGESRLHAEGESAIEFAGGYGKIHPSRWEAQWLLEEKNAEVRRILIQEIGYARICSELQVTELDTWQEYTLLTIDFEDDFDADGMPLPVFLLKMICPSTGFIHALRVPPRVRSAKDAIRWVNWDIDPDEFSVQT
jgi:internalin A